MDEKIDLENEVEKLQNGIRDALEAVRAIGCTNELSFFLRGLLLECEAHLYHVLAHHGYFLSHFEKAEPEDKKEAE